MFAMPVRLLVPVLVPVLVLVLAAAVLVTWWLRCPSVAVKCAAPCLG